MARLENGSYEEIVAHLERELELNALEETISEPELTRKQVVRIARKLDTTTKLVLI